MTDRNPYERVQTSRLYEQVAGQIRDRIMARRLQPGDKLPSESALAKEFGVSRTVVREALKTLENHQLVEVKHGSGAFICEPTSDAILEALSTVSSFRGVSVFDLHGVREILEVEVAALASENASDQQKAQLSRLLVQMEEKTDNPREYVQLDLLFHKKLADATGNGVFLLVIEPLADLLLESRLKATGAPGGLQESLEGHKAIYECVKEGNSRSARVVMRKHLEEARGRLVWMEKAGLISCRLGGVTGSLTTERT